MMRASGSPKTLEASSNVTRCFARFRDAFLGSHSNVTATALNFRQPAVLVPSSQLADHLSAAELFALQVAAQARRC